MGSIRTECMHISTLTLRVCVHQVTDGYSAWNGSTCMHVHAHQFSSIKITAYLPATTYCSCLYYDNVGACNFLPFSPLCDNVHTHTHTFCLTCTTARQKSLASLLRQSSHIWPLTTNSTTTVCCKMAPPNTCTVCKECNSNWDRLKKSMHTHRETRIEHFDLTTQQATSDIKGVKHCTACPHNSRGCGIIMGNWLWHYSTISSYPTEW